MKKFIALLLALMLVFAFVACSENGGKNDDDDEDEDETASVEESNEDEEDGEGLEITFEETVVVDNEFCKITITDIVPDNSMGYTLNVSLENKGAQTYTFGVGDTAINGVQCMAMFSQDVGAGKKANEEIVFFEEDFYGNDIGEYTDVKLEFIAYDDEYNEVMSETVHVYPCGEENAATYVREDKETDVVIVDNEYVKVIVTDYTYDKHTSYSEYCANLYIESKTDYIISVDTDDVSVNGYMIDPYYAEYIYPGNTVFSSVAWDESEFDENGIKEVEEIEFILNICNPNAESYTEYYLSQDSIKLNP